VIQSLKMVTREQLLTYSRVSHDNITLNSSIDAAAAVDAAVDAAAAAADKQPLTAHQRWHKRVAAAAAADLDKFGVRAEDIDLVITHACKSFTHPYAYLTALIRELESRSKQLTNPPALLVKKVKAGDNPPARFWDRSDELPHLCDPAYIADSFGESWHESEYWEQYYGPDDEWFMACREYHNQLAYAQQTGE